MFFTRECAIKRMINGNRFKQRMALPPLHQDFPSTAVLHAIAAVACKSSGLIRDLHPSPVGPIVPGARYPDLPTDPAMITDFSLKHMIYCRRAIDRNLALESDILASAQALAIRGQPALA